MSVAHALASRACPNVAKVAHGHCGSSTSPGKVRRCNVFGLTMQVYLEGPYGAPMIDIHSARYKCVLIVCSGMGWTFGRAMKRQLLDDAMRGRPLASVRSVAVVREQTAGALDSCWGWEPQGGAWPAGLLAQVSTFMTSREMKLA